MKEIRILHLFPRLLSLYGEYGNVSILKNALADNGYSVSVTEFEGDKAPNFEDADFIYIGSGTETALIKAAERLLRCRDEAERALNSGKVWLATGNAMSVFGKKISDNGVQYDGVGLFDYETEIERKKRYLGDALSNADNIFSSNAVGFVNTSSLYKGIDSPLFSFELGKTLGNNKENGDDGIFVKNFFATQLIGPVLVKNPTFLAEIYTKLTGEAFAFSEGSNQVKAYNTALSELKKRLVKSGNA